MTGARSFTQIGTSFWQGARTTGTEEDSILMTVFFSIKCSGTIQRFADVSREGLGEEDWLKNSLQLALRATSFVGAPNARTCICIHPSLPKARRLHIKQSHKGSPDEKNL